MTELPPTAVNARNIAQAGMALLKRGDNKAANEHFERLIQSGLADASIFYALGLARKNLDDIDGAFASVEHSLNLEPNNFQYQLLKADLLAQKNDHRGASAFYLSAVRCASQQPLSTAFEQDIARAKSMCEYYAEILEAQILSKLSANGVDVYRQFPRVAESLDILFGKKIVYAQEPRYFFYPGLVNKPFFENSQFDWITALESKTEVIRDELTLLLRDHLAFQPYVQSNQPSPSNLQNGMLNNPDWSAFYLWKNGNLVHENALRCPQTVEAISKIPLAHISNRSPSVLFSLMRPGAHIPKHNGLINTRLIAHLPIIVPDGCRFRVGNEVKQWQAGKPWVFDDTIEHEAWNSSDQTRVILLFEINRPDIPVEEHMAINKIFEAIDESTGNTPDWEI
jgi:aspartate beta-hydroxylase